VSQRAFVDRFANHGDREWIHLPRQLGGTQAKEDAHAIEAAGEGQGEQSGRQREEGRRQGDWGSLLAGQGFRAEGQGLGSGHSRQGCAEGQGKPMIAALGIGLIGTILVVVLVIAVILWLVRRA
jgi:hypothetical protein